MTDGDNELFGLSEGVQVGLIAVAGFLIAGTASPMIGVLTILFAVGWAVWLVVRDRLLRRGESA